MQIRTYDFVVDRDENANFHTSKPSLYRTTVAHSGTVLFDPESETVVYDMVAPEDPSLRSYFLSETRMISCGSNHKGIVVWSATGNTAPDKFHTTHDAITSCHFSYDDRICIMGTQVRGWILTGLNHLIETESRRWVLYFLPSTCPPTGWQHCRV